MSEAPAFPTSVVLGLWLNAAQVGSISQTDATNALETITDRIHIRHELNWPDTEKSTWLDLVRQVVSMPLPVAVALPVDGDPAGVPQQVLLTAKRDCGVVAINGDLLLFQNLDSEWVLARVENKVMHYDLNQTRRILTEQIAISTAQLAASDLVGDEAEIVESLDAFRSLHLPPHLSKRTTDSLETAAKILLVARGAVSKSIAMHSPSIDRLRLKHLEELIAKSRTVLQSVVTS
jgi:hypothetical protein